MTTAVRQDDLQNLGNILQDSLLSELSHYVPLQVQCTRKQETLMVLAQHPPEVAPDQQQTFSTLQKAILEQQPRAIEQVKIYLRVAGQKQPYAFHTFAWPAKNCSSVLDDIETGLIDETENRSNVAGEGSQNVPPENVDEWLQKWREKYGRSTEEINNNKDADVVNTQAEEKTGNSDNIIDISGDFSQAQHIKPEVIEEKSLATVIKSPAFQMLAGASVSLAVSLGILYGVSRPCVVGECMELKTAEQLNAESTKILQMDKSQTGTIKAQKKLVQSTEILASIPFWSSYYASAQNQLNKYKYQLDILDKFVMASRLAAAAMSQNSNPPYPVQVWVDMQALWEEAMAKLESIPSDSKLYQLSREKIQEYRRNLANTKASLNLEQQANKKLDIAKSTAKVAEARQGIAVSVENWQVVQSTWLTAINTLRSIPLNTTAFVEGQQLLNSYQDKLVAARDKQNQEQISIRNYNLAQNFATIAKTWQERNQWARAISIWQRALAYAQQIPNGSYYYPQAQQMIASYSNSLQLAEANVAWNNRVQQISAELNQICAGSPTICTYTVNRDGIKIRITPNYKETITKVGTTNNIKTRAGVIDHLRSLETALETISINYRLPLEIYSPDGYLIANH